MRPHRICGCYLAVFTRFKGGPVESMGHNVQNMLLAAFAIVLNTMFKAGPFREGHNVLPQNMLLVAILNRFKGGPIESTGHNVFPRNMLLVFLNSYNVQGHIHHKATNVQERVPCGTLTGRLRDHSDPFEFRPTPIHATPFKTRLIHGIYCPSMALVLALLNRWVIMRPHRICCCYLAVFTRFKGGPVESMGHDVLPQTLLFCHKVQGQPC